MRILFVCTGNMCRSPIAERLAASWAEQALGASAAAIFFASAGTDAHDGRHMDSKSAQALGELGGDATGFTSRLLARGEAERFDLVLTMSRRHRHTLLKHTPRALRRTFTLPEAADLLSQADTAGVSKLALPSRAGELAARLNDARAYRRQAATDDVPDPIGRSLADHRRAAALIADALEPVMDVLLAPVAELSHPRPAPGPALPPVPLAVPHVHPGGLPPNHRHAAHFA